MQRYFAYFGVLAVLVVGIITPLSRVTAATAQCFCQSNYDISLKDVEKLEEWFNGKPPKYTADCNDIPENECAGSAQSPKLPFKYSSCEFISEGEQACRKKVIDWKEKAQAAIKEILKQKQGQGATPTRTGLIERVLPACIFKSDVEGECRNITIFVKLAINLANVLLGIVGALALGVFIYGGFILILSEGSAEKIKKGTGAMTAALIGIAIVFAAFLLVKFLGQAIGLQSNFGL
jgi:hypothetical protein